MTQRAELAFHAIIPAGGAGTRLWPLSRRSHPKFLLDLTGAGRTMLQQTVDRLEALSTSITVVTGQVHQDAVRAQLGQGVEVVAEPSPRDSMAAIGLAAAIVQQRHGAVVVGSFAADHVIADVPAFQAAVREACVGAAAGQIVTIGLTPAFASTGFGYIKVGQRAHLEGAPHLCAVSSFTEKPGQELAQRYVDSGEYCWNAGMFVARTDVLLGALRRELPELAAGLERIAAAWDTPQRQEVLEQNWPLLTKIAIDHAIAEPCAARGEVACVPAEFGWSDLGGYAALADVLPATLWGTPVSAGAEETEAGTEGAEGAGAGAAGAGAGGAGDELAALRELGLSPAHVLGGAQVLAVDSPGSLVTGEEGLVAILGVPGAVVVRTPGALLVTTREREQDVKRVVAAVAALSAQQL
ncbi:mannose-1-phosphate guanylyltransferase [Buchananella felis]|uniref:mannose-1-phosphate guanylyltransferase n=1 Tax=Buchananella felis TaxID=3231492 RepID=UPI00352885BD